MEGTQLRVDNCRRDILVKENVWLWVDWGDNDDVVDVVDDLDDVSDSGRGRGRAGEKNVVILSYLDSNNWSNVSLPVTHIKV